RMLHMASGMASIPAAIAVTLLFHPLRLKIQAWVDKKFFRETVSSEKALGKLADQISSTSRGHDIAQALLGVLENTLHPKSMVLYLRRPKEEFYELHSLGPTEAWPPSLPAESLWALMAYSDRKGLAVPVGDMKKLGLDRILPMRGDSG